MKKLLYPFSLLYRLASYLDRKIKTETKLNIPVISVGNITWGGSGKTPVVVETAKYILSVAKMPVILTRGYGRKDKSNPNVVVRDNKKIISSVSQSGDEPYMISQNVACPVIAGADRIKSADIAKRFNPDVFVLDDGFQHWKIARDLDIVCVNALNPFGNNMIIPAGILRENVSALKRAGVVIITNCNLCDKDKLEILKKQILSVCGIEPICVSYSCDKISKLLDDIELTDDEINQSNFVLLSAIGSPENFKQTAQEKNIKIKSVKIFKDHHKYTRDDIESITKDIDAGDKILTTAKDAVKIKDVLVGRQDLAEKIFVLNVSIKFDSGYNLFKEKINKILKI